MYNVETKGPVVITYMPSVSKSEMPSQMLQRQREMSVALFSSSVTPDTYLLTAFPKFSMRSNSA